MTSHPNPAGPPATSAGSRALPLHRPAAERFHSRLDWLDSWHTFSFASHVDPAWMGFGPLRVINDDTIAAGQGFGPHPHRDMEIITVMVEGQLNHQDSMGHSAALRAGEVQRMSAGTGVVHSEINGGDRSCRLLQIWILPDAPGHAPVYEQKPFPLVAGWTLLIDPRGADGALTIHRPARLWRGRLDAGQTLLAPATADLEAPLGWLQVIDGDVRLAFGDQTSAIQTIPTTLERGDGLGVAQAPDSGAIQALTAGDRGADLLWFALA
jgi:redox-sensitive bicupin YhaK (pirin superfamily)